MRCIASRTNLFLEALHRFDIRKRRRAGPTMDVTVPYPTCLVVALQCILRMFGRIELDIAQMSGELAARVAEQRHALHHRKRTKQAADLWC